MAKILFIKSSPLPEELSRSTQVANYFLEQYLLAHPTDEVEVLDLYNMEVPFIDAELLTAQAKLREGAPLTEHEASKLAEMSKLTDQFMSADKYIFVSPLWNLGVPPLLKAYFDNIAVFGKTFEYTEFGPRGLLDGKVAIHFHGCGGIYSNTVGRAFADPYVIGILEFMGVSVLPTIYVEGIDNQPENAEVIINDAKEKALGAIEQFHGEHVFA